MVWPCGPGPAGASVPEATWRSVLWGVFLCIVFTAASAYSGLKVGQVMEAAIPISILAIGLGRAYPRRSTLLENVIITGIGGGSGSVVGGAVFTLPALYILKLDPHPWQTIFICIAGGMLGVLFLIPLRRYFVRETHGQFPYPEATAITEVLVTGEKGGSQAKLLLQATGIAGVYDFFSLFLTSGPSVPFGSCLRTPGPSVPFGCTFGGAGEAAVFLVVFRTSGPSVPLGSCLRTSGPSVPFGSTLAAGAS